jgi:hypothetical protein
VAGIGRGGEYRSYSRHNAVDGSSFWSIFAVGDNNVAVDGAALRYYGGRNYLLDYLSCDYVTACGRVGYRACNFCNE